MFWGHTTEIGLWVGGLDLSSDKELGFVLGLETIRRLWRASPAISERERFLRSDPTEQEFNSQRVDGVLTGWNDFNRFGMNYRGLTRGGIRLERPPQLVER